MGAGAAFNGVEAHCWWVDLMFCIRWILSRGEEMDGWRDGDEVDSWLAAFARAKNWRRRRGEWRGAKCWCRLLRQAVQQLCRRCDVDFVNSSRWRSKGGPITYAPETPARLVLHDVLSCFPKASERAGADLLKQLWCESKTRPATQPRA